MNNAREIYPLLACAVLRSVQNQLKREPPTVLLICTLLVLHCSFILPHELEPLSLNIVDSQHRQQHMHTKRPHLTRRFIT